MHRLLERQVRKSVGDIPSTHPELKTLLAMVERAYQQADLDREMLQRALELSSSELFEANETLRGAVGLLEATLDGIEDGVLVVDSNNEIVRYNLRFLEIWNLTEDQVPSTALGMSKQVADSLKDPTQVSSMVDLLVRDQKPVTRLLELADDRYLQATTRPVAGFPNGSRVWSFHDLTEVKNAESTIRHFAYHDVLTGLPNRALLSDRLGVATALADRLSHKLGVFFIDIDRFKLINDSLGHSAGDALLKEVVARLSRLVRANDTLARFGGDEFVLLAQNIGGPGNAAFVARRILEAFRTPVLLEERELHVTGSVGVAIYPDDGRDQETLIRRADIALYTAKNMGRDTFELYQPQMNIEGRERLLLENSLRAAIRDREIEVVFQPIHCASSGDLCVAEALARWTSNGEVITPDRFIPVAEDTGLIDELGDVVLEKALAHCAAWRRDHKDSLVVAVNVSPRQLARPGFVERVEGHLAKAGLPPEALEIEITESALMEAGGFGMDVVQELATLGIRLALDDFGTGYSSLGHLRELPISTLKIDRSFVAGCPTDEDDASLVSTIVGLGHSLGLSVVAEGAETDAHVSALVAAGCDGVQGYALGRPEDPEAFYERLRRAVAGEREAQQDGVAVSAGTSQ